MDNMSIFDDPLPATSPYPQLCGLCGCVNTAHTHERCKNCKHDHQYVRSDVLTCTLLANIDHKLDGIGQLLMRAIKTAQADQNAPRIFTPH